MRYYLAVDIGASSGRHIISWIEGGKIKIEEIYRFSNEMENIDGDLCWNLERLFREILNGLKRCKDMGKMPYCMGIDTWAVDYVLLDKENNILGKTYGYRDKRTQGMDKKVYEIIPEAELYQRTGIQKQMFNTIFQLMAVKEKNPEYMEQADSLLMIPDYFNFLLTGVKKTEYTNATTTQLLDSKTRDWDYELIEKLGFNKRMFRGISRPGTIAGDLSESIQQQIGFNCKVIFTTTHDTASAVVAAPLTGDNDIYISSGTWSLLGVERKQAECSLESMKANFTNEGGYNYRIRYLKNIMGLWMIQSVKKEFQEELSFAEICDMASKETITSIVDCNQDSFLAPESMIEAVQAFCRNTRQQVPKTTGEIAAVIYNSLGKCYGDAVSELEKITNCKYQSIHIIGGGANADYLNQLTAKYTGKTVYAGPTEATAVGNLIVQMLFADEFENIEEARNCVRSSFKLKKYYGDRERGEGI